jgi:RNA polymerase sigma-70 factor, ECF subfamily
MRTPATLKAATVSELELLAAARSGDEQAFRSLVDSHRAALHVHCYRMLASLHDAEDALQETLLRAWLGLPDFDARSSLGTWLHRIATNVCLDAIRRRPKRILPIDHGPASDPRDDEPPEPVREPIWIEPYPDREMGLDDLDATPEARYEMREAVELAFIAALQHLPARQRAVLILRDVLGFSAREVAVVLETTVASANSALHRARTAFDERLPEPSQQTSLRSLGDARVRNLVERFVDACEAGDVAAILALLAEDARFAMPPYPDWCRGRDAIAGSWLMPGGPSPGLRYLPTRANGQVALGAYRLEPDVGGYLPLCIDVLAVDEGAIGEVIAFRSVEAFSRFGLPEKLTD